MGKRSRRVFAACTQGASTRAIGTPLALDPRALGVQYDVNEPTDDRYGAEVECSGDVAIVRVCGPLEQYAMWFDGYESCRWRVGLAERFALACAHEDAKAVVLVIDSPGGECAGLFECVRAMRASAAASSKRVVAYVNEAAYSAAYAIACVASEIILPESGGVGSIGVIAELIDVVGTNEKYGINVAVVSAGAHKADGHPDMPISDQALEVTAARVAQLADQFFELVSASRPLSTDEIAGLEAGCFYGTEAVDAGLADGVMGLAELIGSVASGDQGAVAAPEQETRAMKRTGSIAAIAALTAGMSDALSAPRVGATPADVINAGAYKKTETSEVTEETSEKDEDDGTETEKTVTTTTESVTTEDPDAEKDDGDSEDKDDDDSEDDDDKSSEKGTKEASAMIAAAAARAKANAATVNTTRDVLAAVRRITGESSISAQIGALEALSANAARAVKLERRLEKANAVSRKASIASKVDTAIKAGRLIPADRAKTIEFAGKYGAEALDTHLAMLRPVVNADPVRMPAPKGSAGGPPVANVDGLTPEEIRIARSMHIDPDQLAAFKANGGGVPTITH